jgi:carotenoid 1,2-hydratase
MTERGQAERTAHHLTIGASHLEWNGDSLIITIDERGFPLPRPIRGQVRVTPRALTGHAALIDHAGRHRWRPIAPRAHVEVNLASPDTSWSGTGYLDSNDGDEPLERGFRSWDWSRTPLPAGETAILYHTNPRQGPERGIAIRFARTGEVTPFDAPARVALTPSRWGIARATRAEGEARITRTLVDAPFYARSTLATVLLGNRAEAMHESVDLDRFSSLPTQLMLPFRMPRVSASPSRRANSKTTQPIRSSSRSQTD